MKPHAPPVNDAATASTDETLLYESAPEPYLRIDLARSGDTVTVRHSRVVTRGRPVHSLNGDILAVGYAGDTIVAATPVTFPNELRVAARSENGSVRSALAVETSHASAFLPWSEALTHVQLLDAAGSEIASVDVPREGTLKGKVLALTQREFDAKFPEIDFIDASDTSFVLPPDLVEDYSASLAEATPEVLEAVAIGLDLLAPATRAATTTIIAVHFDNLGVNASGQVVLGLGGAGEIYLNADFADPALAERGLSLSIEELPRVIVHEATHNFVTLVEASALGERWLTPWPSEAQQMARALVDQHRLAHGLLDYWRAIHVSAESAGLAGPYGPRPPSTPLPELLTEGFATDYAPSSVQEDIAELVTEVQMERSEPSPVCQFFARQGGGLTAEASLLYTKAVFARHLGLVTDRRFRQCTAGLTVSPQGDGIFLEGAASSLALTDDVTAGTIEEAGVRSLGLRASDGASGYRTLLRVADPEGRPLGLHRLDFVRVNNTRTAANAFLAAHDEVNLARASASGLVFITDAGPERVEGIILMLSMHNALNVVTDLFWMAPFSAPLD